MHDFIILAAGKGSRMHSTLPKVLHSVGGKSLLRHVITTARQLSDGILNIVIGHEAEQVRQSLKNDEKINFVVQENQLGTGHAVRQALPYLKKDSVVLILYGDVPLISAETLKQLVEKVDKSSLGLLTVNLDKPKGYGRIVRNSRNHITAIVEEKDASKKQRTITEVNTGIMAVNSQHLQKWLPKLASDNAQNEYYLTDIIASAVADRVTINSHQAVSEWEVLGVNDRVQQASAERLYQRNVAEDLLRRGVTLFDPDRFDCRGDLETGTDISIDINCIFEGQVTLGNNVSIGANCIVKNSTIGDNTVVHANSMVDDCTLANDCIIGPFARLRPGTKIAEHAKIGNFVETKKSTIGQGSKVNHLSYVGDSVLGKNVNIGAGTITCNYDGVNKHQTTIEDDVFVGSNSALVAPVTLGKKSTIAAGSTITKNVGNDTLALTRSPQKTMDGWERPKKK